MGGLVLRLVGSAGIAALALGAPEVALAQETAARARVIVRLSPSLSREAEAAFDRASGTVPRDAAAPALAAWLERYGAPALAPVHGPRMAERLRRGLSEEAFADSVRRRFPARARRWSRAFRPPDLSRSFVLEPERLSRRSLPALLEALARDPEVEHAEEDKIVRPGEAEKAEASGPERIAAPAAWDKAAGGEGVTVAVVDTGVDATHPDLAGSLWANPGEIAGNGIDDDGNGYVDDTRGWDFLGPRCLDPRPDNDPGDGHGHGTHVAGTVAARDLDGSGVVGVAPRARVMAVKGLDDDGSGLDSQLAAAIVYAADNGADVVNASWSGRGASDAIREAVDYAAHLGVVVVAAAGNAGEDARGYYPGALEPVITVAASDASDAPAWFTNWGSRIDVAAPGVDIVSTRAAGTSLGAPAGDGHSRLSGTSMAAPHVAGLAALVLARHPGFSIEEVRQAIRVSAVDIGRPGLDEGSGYGRVDAPRAVGVDRALAARILDPPDGATVTGTVTVHGFADGPGRARYELAVGEGEGPAAWTTLAEASLPSADGSLGSLDAGVLPDGLYTLRLTAWDDSGRAFVDRIQVIVDEVRFDAPPPPRSPASATVVRPGLPVALEGRADGPSFARYRLEWAAGLHPPSGWTAAGIVLEGDGLRPVDAGRLATWEPPSGARAGYYSFRLLVDNAGFTSEARTLLYLEPGLLSGHWPRPLRPGPWKGVGAHAVTGAAGEPRLALTGPLDNGTRLWRFAADGSSVDVTDDAGASDLAALHPIATADLDGRPGDELLVAHPRLLRAWSADGSSWTFPAPPGHGLVRAVPVIADLDGAPGLEVLAVATSFRAGTGRLQAWRADGTPLGGSFPVEIPDRNLGVSNEGAQRLLVADLEGDGVKEIVLADGPTPDSFSLRLLGADGARRPWLDPAFDGDLAGLAAADLDGDGALEVLVLAVRDGASALHVLDRSGLAKPGWPVALPVGAPGLAVADLDRDGRSEVVVSAGYELHVLDSKGAAFAGAWPRAGAAYFGPPVVGDVDGDGQPEIVVATLRAARIAAPPWPREAGARVGAASGWAPPGFVPEEDGQPLARSVGYYDYELLALRADGSLARSWRLHGARGLETAGLPVPLVADVDGDSLTDIAVVQPLAEPGASVVEDALLTVLATGAAYDEAAPDWPAVRRDGRNTSVRPAVRPGTGGVPSP